MKQSRLIVVLLVLVVALAITAVLAFAQGAPVPQVPGFGPGMMGGGMMGRGQMGSGMMGQGWQGGQMGPGMMNGMSGMMSGMMGNFNLIDVVAEEVGLTADEVRDELATGISIADLAAKYDVGVQVIVGEALAQHQAALDAAVASGALTPEQAATMQPMMASMLATRLSQPWGAGHGGMNGSCPGMGAQGNAPNA